MKVKGIAKPAGYTPRSISPNIVTRRAYSVFGLFTPHAFMTHQNRVRVKLCVITLLLTLGPMTIACDTISTTGLTAPAPVEAESVGALAEPRTIVLMSHDSFEASQETVAAFEEANQAKIEFLKSGDAGAALNQAILAKENPLADVFFGVDNTFFSRAIAAEIFEPYNSAQLADIPEALKLDPENRLLPVDYGDVCLNYDRAWFRASGLSPPSTLEDLIKTDYAGLTVVQNPATSSPGLAFLLATVVHFGEAAYLDYWQQLVANDVLVTDGWEDAYFGQFTRYEGTRPIVVSYASSPSAEIFFAEAPPAEAPTAAVIGKGSCFRQIEFIGILAGSQNRKLAEKLVDFLLSQEFQEDIPLNMFVFPANSKARLPDVFEQHAERSSRPASLPPDQIAAKREDWINAWTETVLR
ncbi:MAG: thiamine ABC transporter substrate-binding protein [Anaerolineae bacterium]|nr:thiamine ABC transporter substrate-binding protein [Anaerolineae bacterium]